MTMSAADILHPQNAEFERFLYASVGEDRNGAIVTVLSTLARLNLDPWQEAAELAALERAAAHSRLGLLLSRFSDVPTLVRDHESVARKLALLLPEHPARATTLRAAMTKETMRSSGMIWTIVAVLLLLIQLMFSGAPGSGG